MLSGKTSGWARSVILLASIAVLTGIGHCSDVHGRIHLKEVYRKKISFPKSGSWPYAVFDSTGRRIFVVEPASSRVEVINWKFGKTIEVREYARLTCKPDGKPQKGEIDAWVPLQGGAGIILGHCSSLYMLDAASLEIRYKLADAEHEGVGQFAVDPDTNLLAVRVTDIGGGHERIRVYELRTGTTRVELPVQGSVGALVYTPDGNFLLSEIMEQDPREPWPPQCTLISWSTRTWAPVDKKKLCPATIHFIPGRDQVFVERLHEELRIQDLKTGATLRSITADRGVYSPQLFNNGHWIVASVANDPHDAPEYAQDFRIWDLDSGVILYESPKRKWPKIPRSDYVPYVQLNLSADDRYLLVTKFEEIVVYLIE